MYRIVTYLFLFTFPSYLFCSNVDISAHLNSSPLRAAFWGLSVKDIETGDNLVTHHADKNFTPASVSKLFTTFLALQRLGPEYRFETSVESSGSIDGEGCLRGNLILKGGGDPVLYTQDLQRLAQEIHRLGVRAIMGRVIGDDSLFSGTKSIIHSEVEDLGFAYCPELSALSLNENCIDLTFFSSEEPSRALSIEQHPDVPYLQITLNPSSDTSLNVLRKLDSNQVIVEGTLSDTSKSLNKRVAVHHPTQYAVQVLIRQLENLGIQIRGQEFSSDPETRSQLALHKSPPLSKIVEKINKESYNLGAELLLLGLLQQFDCPVEELRAELGVPESELALFSGSGLSRHNTVSPDTVSSLLWHAYRESPDLLHSLPIAGIDGTLSNRFHDTEFVKKIRAKTGTLFGVSALAGFAETQSGREVAFCLFVNQYTAPSSLCRREMDALMVKVLSAL